MQKKYTATEREQALARAKTVGPAAASRELSIPISTITHWQQLLRDGAVARKRGPKKASEAAKQGREESTKPVDAPAQVCGVPESQQGQPETPSANEPPTVEKASGKRVAKIYTPSERARVLEFAAAEGVSAAAKKFGITRFTIYEWQRRVELHAQGKANHSPVVGSDENLSVLREQRILLVWRAHPGLGPSQVRNQLRRQGFKVSVHTVRCVLEKNGYVPPKVRRTESDGNYEAVRPNQLWHLDFLHRHIHKQKVCLLLLLDDWSRFIVGGALWDGERVAAVQETFLAAVNRHGKPALAMSDGGSAFHSWRGVGAFTRLLEELEVDQLIASTPQSNGKLEVLNANIQKELFNQEQFFDLGEAQHRLTAWINFYNFRRTHHALGGLLVPADRYFGRAEEVLACIEAGKSPDGVGEPAPVGDRQLDLFRISSCRGRVELHLLGHRILLPMAG